MLRVKDQGRNKEEPRNDQRTPKRQKCFFLRLLPKKVDSVTEKVDSFPKKTDLYPQKVFSIPKKMHFSAKKVHFILHTDKF